MPLATAFTATQSLSSPANITFTDTSTGTDVTITNRKIYVRLANGNWLTANGESSTVAYTNWSYSDVSTTVQLLSASTACDVTIEWLAGSTVVYSLDNSFCFNLYDYLFGLQVLQGNTSSPGQVQDTSYFNNLIQFVVNIFNEESAIEFGGDIYSSQGAMNRNAIFINNENDFF